MPENRNERLAADYREMLAIQGQPYLSWIASRGEPPYAEEYLMTVKVRTYAFTMRSGVCTVGAIRRCTVLMTLRPSYPDTAPCIRMLDIPPVFHPNWYSKGMYCAHEPWRPERSLKDYVKQMIGTLCNDPNLIETDYPANYKALDWYLKHRDDASLFPSDTVELTENSEEQTAAAERDAATFDEVADSWRVDQR